MEKKDVLARINEIKKQIKTNSKDAHFAETLCDELVKKVKEWRHEPLPVADLGKEIDRLQGETFFIAKHENGVLFHGANLYDFVLPYSLHSHNMVNVANWLVENKDTISKEDEGMQKAYQYALLDFEYAFRMLIAMWFGLEDSEKMKVDVMERFYKYLNDMSEKALNAELQEETPIENAEFKEATLAMEDVKDTLKEAADELKGNE